MTAGQAPAMLTPAGCVAQRGGRVVVPPVHAPPAEFESLNKVNALVCPRHPHLSCPGTHGLQRLGPTACNVCTPASVYHVPRMTCTLVFCMKGKERLWVRAPLLQTQACWVKGQERRED